MIEELYIGKHTSGIPHLLMNGKATSLGKRRTELATMQDRLLNAYLAGTIEDVVYQAKSNELKAETLKGDEALANWAMWTRQAAKKPWRYSTGRNKLRKCGEVQTIRSGVRSWIWFV